MKAFLKLTVIGFILISCKTGNLDVLSEISSSLEETSAIEKMNSSDLLWVIEDAGNKNHVYGLDINGKIIKDIEVVNAVNEDWEDLTSDLEGNIYIGDFGNNSEKRKQFSIYKISNIENASDKVKADLITFSLPKDMASVDFESFFVFNNYFYIFSKDHKSCELIKVPNAIGTHEAVYVSKTNLKGKHDKVTSADISEDGKTVVLLNHDKLWKITGFSGDNFLDGTTEVLEFQHDSQKEGICMINNHEVLISDERNKHDGSHIYKFDFNKKE